jgi:hypothetical protein
MSTYKEKHMTEEVKAPAAASAPEAVAAPEATAPDLNINDLAALRSILDVASSRGAFKAAELEAVGKIYNKLNSFLEAVTKKDQ